MSEAERRAEEAAKTLSPGGAAQLADALAKAERLLAPALFPETDIPEALAALGSLRITLAAMGAEIVDGKARRADPEPVIRHFEKVLLAVAGLAPMPNLGEKAGDVREYAEALRKTLRGFSGLEALATDPLAWTPGEAEATIRNAHRAYAALMGPEYPASGVRTDRVRDGFLLRRLPPDGLPEELGDAVEIYGLRAERARVGRYAAAEEHPGAPEWTKRPLPRDFALERYFRGYGMVGSATSESVVGAGGGFRAWRTEEHAAATPENLARCLAWIYRKPSPISR